MPIAVGETLPDATLLQIGENGPEEVDLSAKLKGRKVVIFGVPGAFTGTCSEAHVPSFMRTKDQFDAKGIDEVICVSVNDPFVMDAWSKQLGAGDAGLTMLADPASSYGTAAALAFDAPPVGFYGRLSRHAMYLEDGVVKVIHIDESPGVCNVSAGEAMLEVV